MITRRPRRSPATASACARRPASPQLLVESHDEVPAVEWGREVRVEHPDEDGDVSHQLQCGIAGAQVPGDADQSDRAHRRLSPSLSPLPPSTGPEQPAHAGDQFPQPAPLATTRVAERLAGFDQAARAPPLLGSRGDPQVAALPPAPSSTEASTTSTESASPPAPP